MIKNCIFILFTLLILNSCGKSKEEIELEKAKTELEKTKLELANEKEKKIAEKEAELIKIHENKINAVKRKKIAELNKILQDLPKAIEEAKQNIKNINEFEIGRPSSKKAEQLNEARIQLNEIFKYRERIENEIVQLEFHKTFEFQKEPTTVMKFIFESAKKRDFSKFRNLCDPYGENDSDVKQICYAEMLLDNQKNKIKSEFENGRIIGEPEINEDKAKVEFAFGPSTNKLEKMTMIKRNRLWYLLSF